MLAYTSKFIQIKSLVEESVSRATKLPIITLTLSTIAAAIMLLPGLNEALEFDRTSIASGQWARVLTGHLTHWNFDHYIWDGLVFLVLGVLCESRNRSSYVLNLLMSAALISLLVWFWMPELSTYRGLSGIDTALFTFLTGNMLAEKCSTRQWRWVAAIVVSLLALGLKLGYEMCTGQMLFVDSEAANFIPLASAHAVGACVGLMLTNWSNGITWYSQDEPQGANSMISSP